MAELAVSPLTTRLVTGLAASDLALAYDNGLLTRRALLLGMRELSRAGAASSASSASSAHANSPAAPRAYRLTLAFTDAGKAHREAAAGVAVLCERPMNGTTLLYMRGDPMAWRGFDSPQALLEDVRNNVAGLGDRLAQRLPAVAAQRARIGAVSAALQDGRGASLAELTSHTILDVVRADTPLSAAAAGTGARIAA
ncbi:hypothetical protein AB870_17235 [Pandoraea faecigallinarum]|uniref:Dermonecrotic toxin N-terminal domain-containing protein n=1 Tax=Pandoraea faecigallinarum TaxID=656179 RepID=A0A0H3WTE6_9BURK|nr:hypothetical protein AB870_17235 [Pandoraea faecigallinarum]